MTRKTMPLSLAVASGAEGKGRCTHSLFRYRDGKIADCCLMGAIAISYLGEDECIRLTQPEHLEGASKDHEAYEVLKKTIPWLFKGDAGNEVLRIMGLNDEEIQYLHDGGYIKGDLASCLSFANDDLANGFNMAKDALVAIAKRSEIIVTYHLVNGRLAVK